MGGRQVAVLGTVMVGTHEKVGCEQSLEGSGAHGGAIHRER